MAVVVVVVTMAARCQIDDEDDCDQAKGLMMAQAADSSGSHWQLPFHLPVLMRLQLG